jgi:hypothetical protein
MVTYRFRNYDFLVSWKEDNMATNYNRPNLPYQAESLPNSNRYALLAAKKQPPTAAAVDGDINYIVDSLNGLDDKIGEIEAGVLVGANNPANAGLFVTTDGNAEAPTILWKKVDATNVVPESLTTACLADGATTNEKLGPGAATADKIAPAAITGPKIAANAITSPKIAENAIITEKITDLAITTPKLANQAATQEKIANAAVGTPQLIDANVTTAKIADVAVTTQQLADAAVTNPKIGLLAVTAPQISSAGSNLGDVLTSNGAGAASFLANVGKVLQIVSYEDASFFRNEYDAAASPINLISFKTAPFLLKITPRKTNSKIILFYSINVGSYRNQYASITLCKNNLPFKVGQDDPSYKGVTHSIYSQWGRNYSDGEYGCYNFSNLFVDTGVLGTEIAYEIKKAQPYTGINSGYAGGYATVSTMHAIEIDI